MKTIKGAQKIKSIRCHGPLENLEHYLQTDWWKEIFNATYLKTDGDVVENEENTRKDIDLVMELMEMSPKDAVLDVCCGQGRHVLELVRRGFKQVTGIDRSRYLIRVAKKRRDALHCPSVRFLEGDARKIRLHGNAFDKILIMGNSFGYFEQQDDDEKVLAEMLRLLKSKGTLFLDVTDGEYMSKHFQPRSWEWIGPKQLVCRERSLAHDRCRLISREVVIHSEQGVLVDQFYAERLYHFEDLNRLLKKVGFEDVVLHRSEHSLSLRNQDLGMMEHRLLITARAPEKREKVASKKEKPFSCQVILGDPRLPDKVKLGGKFNPEDMEAVHKFKEALSEIKSFSFKYFDNHKSLIGDIINNKIKFVFNLCDEGFHNEAQKELHVPALLEMERIPYSGSNPATLALCYNKSHVRNIANNLGIAVPEEVYVSPQGNLPIPFAHFPALIKPAMGDGSIGITQRGVVKDFDALMHELEHVGKLLPGIPILIQEYLSGREYSVGLIGNGPSCEALPVLEVDYSNLPKGLPHILGYESKWDPTSPYWSEISYKPAQLEEEKLNYLIEQSKLLFTHFGCCDYARIDWREDRQGRIKLLEINPNAALCWDGKLSMMASFAKMSYAELLKKVLLCALERNNLGEGVCV